jgi:molybdopterin/thiamine biosynthesis adenylyltransferase
MPGDRYDRHVRFLGEDGQQALQETAAAVVGLGGVGSLLTEQLARLGVQDLVLLDPDTVEESNLPRLYGATADDVDRPKVAVAADHASAINPAITVTATPDPIEQHGSIVDDVDVVLTGVDQVSGRAYVNEQAVRYETAFIDAGSRIDTQGDRVTDMQGFVQVVNPGTTACFDCLGRGDSEIEAYERMTPAEREEHVNRGYIEGAIMTPQPAVIHLNSVVASIAINQCVKLVTGFDEPTGFIRYDGLNHGLTPMKTDMSHACPTCDALLGRGDADVEIKEPDTDWTRVVFGWQDRESPTDRAHSRDATRD